MGHASWAVGSNMTPFHRMASGSTLTQLKPGMQQGMCVWGCETAVSHWTGLEVCRTAVLPCFV